MSLLKFREVRYRAGLLWFAFALALPTSKPARYPVLGRLNICFGKLTLHRLSDIISYPLMGVLGVLGGTRSRKSSLFPLSSWQSSNHTSVTTFFLRLGSYFGEGGSTYPV
jgi:hypothetical protein